MLQHDFAGSSLDGCESRIPGAILSLQGAHNVFSSEVHSILDFEDCVAGRRALGVGREGAGVKAVIRSVGSDKPNVTILRGVGC